MQDPRSVEKLRRGDVSALKRTFKANHAKLFPLVFRLTHDREATDTIIRAALRQLWADRRELDPFEVLDLRLVAYARSLAGEYASSNGVKGIAYGARGPEGRNVAKILEQVPEKERLMYLLHVVDGYSIRELASAFSTSEEQVRVSIGAALVMLDEVLKDGPANRGDFSKLDGSQGDERLWP